MPFALPEVVTLSRSFRMRPIMSKFIIIAVSRIGMIGLST